jgi:GrpB-like predicted nucleotidyltransferase (UPF0157 family)
MGKDLNDMSPSELGQLFPIQLHAPNPKWPEMYQIESKSIARAVGAQNIVRMNHFGSTSVPGLIAKPTIDILLEIREATDIDKLTSDMKNIGYLLNPQPDNPPPHALFLKGYTLRGFEGQAYHVHVRYSGDWNELYFRDYLRLHPGIARAYGEMKEQCKLSFEHDRDAYTEAKTEFIQKHTEDARKEFGNRYS